MDLDYVQKGSSARIESFSIPAAPVPVPESVVETRTVRNWLRGHQELQNNLYLLVDVPHDLLSRLSKPILGHTEIARLLIHC